MSIITEQPRPLPNTLYALYFSYALQRYVLSVDIWVAFLSNRLFVASSWRTFIYHTHQNEESNVLCCVLTPLQALRPVLFLIRLAYSTEGHQMSSVELFWTLYWEVQLWEPMFHKNSLFTFHESRNDFNSCTLHGGFESRITSIVGSASSTLQGCIMGSKYMIHTVWPCTS